MQSYDNRTSQKELIKTASVLCLLFTFIATVMWGILISNTTTDSLADATPAVLIGLFAIIPVLAPVTLFNSLVIFPFLARQSAKVCGTLALLLLLVLIAGLGTYQSIDTYLIGSVHRANFRLAWFIVPPTFGIPSLLACVISTALSKEAAKKNPI